MINAADKYGDEIFHHRNEEAMSKKRKLLVQSTIESHNRSLGNIISKCQHIYLSLLNLIGKLNSLLVSYL